MQLPGRCRLIVENLTDFQMGLAVHEGLLHPGIRRVHRSGGLLDETADVLALRKHFGEELKRHELRFRIQVWSPSCHALLPS